MATFDEVYSAALALPDESRADLVFRLLDSLPADPGSEQISPALESLLVERARRFESGLVGSEDAFAAIHRLKQKLAERKAS